MYIDFSEIRDENFIYIYFNKDGLHFDKSFEKIYYDMNVKMFTYMMDYICEYSLSLRHEKNYQRERYENISHRNYIETVCQDIQFLRDILKEKYNKEYSLDNIEYWDNHILETKIPGFSLPTFHT